MSFGMKVLFLLILCSVTFSLNVELSVKECAGSGSQGYPVAVIVPLPEGQFSDISRFRVTDAGDATVPAQFDVLIRRWVGDKSIANLSVNFQPIVAAFTSAGTGISKYYLKDDGSGNSSGTGLQVTSGAGAITVVTGPLKFIVSKTAFNILDQVWLDKNNDHNFATDEAIITSNNRNGGEFVGRLAGDVQYDAGRSDLKVDIEEAGPMRAVIRVEAVTKYNSTVDHVHGWAVRIYAYAGKSFVKIDYQLQNSAKNKVYAWPLYFQAMNLNFNLNMGSNPTVRVGTGSGNVFSQARGKGLCLAQTNDSLFKVFSLPASDSLSGGKYTEGFMEVDDGAVGVTAVTRYFWQMWPNGLAIDSTNKLSIQLFPDWSSQLRGMFPVRPMSTHNWYWLKDMQHVYKEVALDFHTSGVSNAQLTGFAKTFQYNPVTTYSTAWGSEAKASLDMGGLLPFTQKTSTTDDRLPPKPTDKLNVGWNYFDLLGRREGTAAPGGWSFGDGRFFVSENPADYYTSESHVMGDLNDRPHSMAQYTYANDFQLLRLGTNYVDGTSLLGPNFTPSAWRQQIMGADKQDTLPLADTWSDVTIVDDAHFWMYHLRDAYYMTGNPWLKDWYRFSGELRKTWLQNDTLYFQASRQVGHVFSHALQAYQTTGDTAIFSGLHKVIAGGLKRSIRPLWGERNSACCGAPLGENTMQSGYLCHFLINFMEEAKNGNPQAYADAFQLVAGMMSWNLKFGNFGTTWAPVIAPSTDAGLTLADPQAWYYWNTGLSIYKKQLIQYCDSGILGGTMPASWIVKMATKTSASTGKPVVWNGQWEGRWVQFVRQQVRTDTVPPAAITDLKLSRNGNQCVLTWTGPQTAVHYHVVYGNKPIVGDANGDNRYLNWWAANAVGVNFKATPGSKESLTFTLPDTGFNLAFAAVMSFDSASNMSVLSNLGRSDSTAPSAPVNVQATAITSQQINLAWQNAVDAESGIWFYNVYRNSVKIATVEANTFSDNNLNEQTAYSYEVSAVNGALMEGAKVSVNQNTPVDQTAPSVVLIRAISSTPTITLVFSEVVDSVSAVNKANYTLNQGKNVTGAVLSPDKKTVTLTCDNLAFGAAYSLTISGVKDRAVTPNAMSNVSVSFIYKEPFAISNTTQKLFVWDVMELGMYTYLDGDLILKTAPENYLHMPFLRMPNDANCTITGDSIVAFTINKEAMVYVAYDDKQRENNRTPSWLTRSFTDNGEDVSIFGKTSLNTWVFSLYQRKYAAGSTVVLGGNNGIINYSNYMVIVIPTDSSFVGPTSTETPVLPEFVDAFSVFPNPFNPRISIALQCRTGASEPAIRIYNIQGRSVACLRPFSRVKAGTTGRYQYQWDAAGHGSGMYLVKVEAAGKLWKKKILLVR